MNEVPDIVLFFGRFHPLVVHLPIGFLIFAFILEVWARWKKNLVVASAVPLALLLGAVSATVACILGYMLSLSGDYNEDALDTHFWFGVGTTFLAFVAWLISIEKIKLPNLHESKPYIATLTLIVILLSATGHYGGNLTHGSDYLTAYAPFGDKKKDEVIAVTSVEEASIFTHVVNPILQDKCASCHNSGKMKGGLSFHSADAIQKGGTSGPAFVPGDAAKSEMFHRVTMNPEDEKFMPPEGKTPMTEQEIALLTYWIDNAQGSYEAKVSETETPDDIRTAIAAVLGLDASAQEAQQLASVGAVSDETLRTLEEAGFVVRELVAESNLYDVTLPPKTKNLDVQKINELLKKLDPVKANVVWLSLPDNDIQDGHLAAIKGFPNLKKLRLEKNPITDKGVAQLKDLPKIEVLNLYQTKITKNVIPELSKFKNLKKTYVWGTAIEKTDIPEEKAEGAPQLVFGS